MKIQKKFCHLITFSNYIATSRPLFQLLSILSVYDMYKYQLLIHIYRSTNSLTKNNYSLPYYISNSFIHQYCTRQQYNLHVPKCQTFLRQRTIVFQSPKLWNSLPLELRTSHSLNSFKRSLKSFLLLNYMINSFMTCFILLILFYCIHDCQLGLLHI